MNKYFRLIFIGCLLIVVIISGINSTADSYYSFYYPKKTDSIKPLVFHLSQKIEESLPLRFFDTYTGFDTGYGFFSPNVASSFIIVFKIYDDDCQLIKAQKNIAFKSKEGLIRFTSFQTMFLHKLEKNTTHIYDRYLDIVMEQLSKSVLKKYPSTYSVESSLYLYDYPNLKAFNKIDTIVKPKLYLVNSYSL